MRTRPVPSSTDARLRLLLAAHRHSTRRVAAVLGVSQRTVQRWVTKEPGARRPPGPQHLRAIEEAVLARWQPRIRARRRAQAEAEGFVFHIRARFGFAAAAGSSDDPRVRWVTQYLPGEVARELFAARDAGAGEQQQQQQLVILARALGHAYFRAAGGWCVRPASLRASWPAAARASSTPCGRPGLGDGPQVAGVGAAWLSPPRVAGGLGCLAWRTIPGPRRKRAGRSRPRPAGTRPPRAVRGRRRSRQV